MRCGMFVSRFVIAVGQLQQRIDDSSRSIFSGLSGHRQTQAAYHLSRNRTDADELHFAALNSSPSGRIECADKGTSNVGARQGHVIQWAMPEALQNGRGCRLGISL